MESVALAQKVQKAVDGTKVFGRTLRCAMVVEKEELTARIAEQKDASEEVNAKHIHSEADVVAMVIKTIKSAAHRSLVREDFDDRVIDFMRKIEGEKLAAALNEAAIQQREYMTALKNRSSYLMALMRRHESGEADDWHSGEGNKKGKGKNKS